MDFNVVRFALAMVIGTVLGAVLGWPFGSWIFDDRSIGIGLGVVIGAGVGSLIGVIVSS